MSSEDRPDRARLRAPDLRQVQAQLEAWTTPVDPGHTVAETSSRQGLAVSCCRERNPRVGVEMIDMRGVDESVHRRVDRWCRATPTMEAVVEGSDHLVLALDAGIDVCECAQSVEPQNGEAGLGQRAQVAARALDPEQVHRRAGHGVDPGSLGRGVPAGVVRVARV